MVNMMSSKRGRIYYLFLSVLIISLSTALFYIGLLATKMRLSGDDYCFNAILSQEGFWGMQPRSYIEVSMVSGNRFSQTFFSGLAGLSPTWGNALLVISCLIAWVAGMMWLVRWLSTKLQFRLTRVEALIIAESFACLVLWSTERLDQSVLWRSAMTAYFLPIAGFTWLLLFVIWTAQSESQKWWKLVIIYLTALISAGFSETAAAVGGGFLGLVLTAVLSMRVRKNKHAKRFLFPLLISIFGVMTAVALLYFSPVTAMRRSTLPEPITAKELLSLLALNIKTYLWLAVMRRTLTLVLPFGFGLGLGLLYVLGQRNMDRQKMMKPTWKNLILWIVLLSFASIFLIACVMLPATYVQVSYPPERALILAQVVLTTVCIVGGVLILLGFGDIFNLDRIKNAGLYSLLKAVSLMMILSVTISSVLLLQKHASKLEFYDRWSRFWDERHEELMDAGRKNKNEIHVIELDHVISDVGELSPDPDYWYNNCAEMYYGIDKIYADQPGW